MEAPETSAIDAFLDNNARYAAGFTRSALPAPPSRKIAVVTCMDARLDTGCLLGLEGADAHVLRNAGGVVTEDVIRSLTLSQRLLGTREIMRIHHTDCGMLKFTDAEMTAAIQKDTGVRPPFTMEAFTDPEEDTRQSIARIQASPFIVHKDAVGGFVFSVETGRLLEVD